MVTCVTEANPFTSPRYSGYVLQYSTEPLFLSDSTLSVVVPAPSSMSASVSTLLTSLTVDTQYYIQVAVTSVSLNVAGVPLPQPLPAMQQPVATTPRLPVISAITTPLGGVPTEGGVMIDIVGTSKLVHILCVR